MAHDPRQLDSDALEAQTRSLRQLARGLVGDEHRVDDVVQEAWVTALQKPARRGFSLGGWLAGITRNHARDEMRSQRRRDARERIAARPESQPVDDPLERLDTLRDLLEHARALDEPYRSTLLRRYVDGLSARAISKQDGIPLATVRTRITRALERLRERLDRSRNGDRRAWLVPLIPLAAGPQGGLPAPVADGLTQLAGVAGLGAAGMSAKTQFGVCAAVIALVTWLAMSGGPDHMGEQLPVEPPPQVATARIAHVDEPVENTEPDRAPVEEFEQKQKLNALLDSLPKATITGFVRNDQGEPIAGATIQGRGEPVTTDADGKYATEPAITVRATETQLRVSAPGHAAVRKAVHLTTDSTEVRVDITLPRGFVIHGRVTDTAGAPVVGAKVTTFYASEFVAETDANGDYRLDRLDPGRPKHMLYARAEGWLEAKTDVATDGTEIRCDLVMHPGSGVRGVVLDAGGNPVAGAAMFIGDSPYSYDRLDAESAAAGDFHFPTVKPGRQKLVTQVRGYAADIRTIEVPAAGGVLDLEIELTEGITLSGRVIDRAGRPIDGASISMRCSGMSIDRSGRADADGRFTIEALPSRGLQMRVYQTGFVDTSVREIDPSRELTVTMEPIAKIAGRVVDKRTGEPIQQFQIRFVDPELREGERRGGGYNAVWVREGFSFSSVDGTWDTGDETLREGFLMGIEARALGYAPGVVRRVIAKPTMAHDELRIELERGTELVGTLVADDTGAPVADALIKVARAHNPVNTADSDDTHGRAMTRSDANGAFQFAHLAAGELHLVIEHPEHGVVVHRVEISPGFERLEETVRFDRRGTIHGTAKDASGAGMADATIRVQAIDVPGIDRRSWSTPTDANGNYEVSRLPAGVYRVSRREKAGRHALDRASQYVRIAGPERHAIDLTPGEGPGRIRGHVRSASTLPGTLRVSISQRGGDGPWNARFAPRQTVTTDGAFEFSGLSTGTYRLRLRHFDRPTMTMHEVDIEVEVDASGDTTVDLEPTTRKLG